MSHRRSNASKQVSLDNGESTIIVERHVPADGTDAIPASAKEVLSLSIDCDCSAAGAAAAAVEAAPLGGGDAEHAEDVGLLKVDDGDNEQLYEAQRHQRRIRHWKESPFACGLTEPGWVEERTRPYQSDSRRNLPPDETGCLCCSAYMCPVLRAGRVGNMAVLRSHQEWVEEDVVDEETGQMVLRRVTRPKLDIVVGPYWPMLCFVTYPLILGVSAWTYIAGISTGTKPFLVSATWFICTLGLITALAFTACRDPGILYRVRDPHDASWRWSDQADSFRPRDAWFDSGACVVVVVAAATLFFLLAQCGVPHVLDRTHRLPSLPFSGHFEDTSIIVEGFDHT
jgi:hypothetical protein